MGATDVLNPTKKEDVPEGKTIQAVINEATGFGCDYTFDCTGNTEVMRSALECSARGWGVSVVIGVAAAGKEIATRPFQLITGRTWKGTAFGGWKSKPQVPELADRVEKGELKCEEYITHKRKFDEINEGFDLLEK